MKKAGIAALLLGALLAYQLLSAPLSDPSPVEVSVPSGAPGSAIARSLAGAGIVRSAFVFKLAAFLKGKSSKLKAGDYEIPKNLSALEVVDFLVSGKALQKTFLVPEGLAALQIARNLEARKLANAPKFMKLMKDTSFAKKLGVAGPGLEGFLFPDSYRFARGIPEAELIKMMVLRFNEKVPAALLAKGASLGLNPRQVLTLASIIEKEARADADRPKVARVFLNRKAQKMRLESCASVRYALDKYQGPVLFKDLEVNSPYNTYRHWGLPPGPICSPGLKSIEAAVNPEKGNWLFFVVAGDGTHVFSETFEEHKKAKLHYKRLKKGVVED